MRYKAYIDVEYQRFVIEDSNGTVIAIRHMPTDISPNPGKEALMARADNTAAWDQVYELVEAANRGINKKKSLA